MFCFLLIGFISYLLWYFTSNIQCAKISLYWCISNLNIKPTLFCILLVRFDIFIAGSIFLWPFLTLSVARVNYSSFSFLFACIPLILFPDKFVLLTQLLEDVTTAINQNQFSSQRKRYMHDNRFMQHTQLVRLKSRTRTILQLMYGAGPFLFPYCSHIVI